MKNKRKTIQLIITTLIMILVLSTVCLAGGEEETTKSTGGDYNGSAEDADKVSGSADQFTQDELGLGFSVNRTGYRFYIAQCYTPDIAYGTEEQHDQFGDAKIITLAPVDVYMSEPPKPDEYKIVNYRTLKEGYKTGTYDFLRVDDDIASVKGKLRVINSYTAEQLASDGMSGLPAPIAGDGKNFYSNGIAFKKWMLTPNGTEGNNGTALITYFWGEEMLTKLLENDDYYLVVEPIMWSSKYKFKTGKLTGGHWTTETSSDGRQVIFLGTAQEWAYYMATEGDQKGLGLSTDDTGKSCYINIIYSSALPKCMLLERVNSRFSTAYPEADRLNAKQIMYYGYGEHVFRADDLAGDILATGTL